VNGLLIDLTQFSRSPAWSGLQRMLRELFVGWPNDVAASVGIQTEGNFLCVDVATAALLFENHFSERVEPSRAANATVDFFRDRATKRFPARMVADCVDSYLLPELTYEDDVFAATAHCRTGGIPTMAIVADSIPIVQPELIAGKHDPVVDRYFREVLRFDAISCISQHTEDVVSHRLRRQRRPQDAIHLLGADGLRTPRPERPVAGTGPVFVALGSLERRKRTDVLLRAVQRLVTEGEDVSLLLIGSIPVSWPAVEQAIADSPAWLQWVGNADDSVIVDAFHDARAAVFISGSEGYGLPALEALWNGCPVIVDAGLPALAGIAAGGQIRLDEVTEETVAHALRSLLQTDTAAAYRSSAVDVALPTWRQWAVDVAHWTESVVR
jgi:glycosyltransferase involved in cell wall biosynthesis